ncbi:MAG: polysaccharide pyruvyl transferase family protein [bacterium]
MSKNILFWRLQQMQRSGSNIGDRAISNAMFSAISKAVPDARFFVYTRNPEFLPSEYNCEGINIFNIKGFINGIRVLAKADLVILGGGTIIQDKSSKMVIIFNLSFACLALLFRKKVMCYAIGIGGKSEISPFGRWLARMVLNRCAMITLRDTESAKMSEEIGVTRPPTFITADAAVLHRQAPPEKIDLILEELGIKPDDRPLIAISLRRVFHRTGGILPVSVKIKFGLMNNNWEKKIKIFKNKVANICDELIERYNAILIFVPMYTGESFFSPRDDIFTQKVVARMKHKSATRILKKHYTPAQIKGLFSMVDLVIGVPLHSVILATTAGTPAISLCYADKNIRYMRMIGMEDITLDLRKFNNTLEKEKLMNLVDYCLKNKGPLTLKLKKRINLLKQECEKNASLLLDVLY